MRTLLKNSFQNRIVFVFHKLKSRGSHSSVMLEPDKSNCLVFFFFFSCDSALLGHSVESSGGIRTCDEKRSALGRVLGMYINVCVCVSLASLFQE